MFQRFFVPLDGSPRAEKAIPVAAKLARHSAGTLILARVIVPLAVEGHESNIIANEACLVRDKEVSEARAYLNEIAERYKRELDGLHLILDVLPSNERISSTLLSLAEQQHTDLIVLCSRAGSRLRRWLFGSIAQDMMRRSPLPVLVLNDHASAFPLGAISLPLRLLVALDGSPRSESVLQSACQLLALFPTTPPHELHLLRVVVDPPAFGYFGGEAYAMAIQQKEEGQRAEKYLQEVARKLSLESGTTGFVVTTSVVTHANPAITILQQAQPTTTLREGESQNTGYDLIALATHGRSGMKRVLLGSVTEHVFGTTTLPLLIVCPVIEAEKKQREVKTEQEEVAAQS